MHKVSNVQNPNNNLSRKRSIDCLLEEEEQTENANEEQTEEEYDERARVDEDGFMKKIKCAYALHTRTESERT